MQRREKKVRGRLNEKKTELLLPACFCFLQSNRIIILQVEGKKESTLQHTESAQQTHK